MSAISLRLPNYLHAAVRDLAERENVSINQFITLALAEKISALLTEDYLAKRASRGSRNKFERTMAKVADVEPLPHDAL
ncbi:MAG TPA: toxin-antitoxin system HicB family antitoxin [Anaerolineae bacterium]|nr:toxin-antitoxin system HicB family antitoxin [Anaerolineae bacterium]